MPCLQQVSILLSDRSLKFWSSIQSRKKKTFLPPLPLPLAALLILLATSCITDALDCNVYHVNPPPVRGSQGSPVLSSVIITDAFDVANLRVENVTLRVDSSDPTQSKPRIGALKVK